jgi:hypothetical protein
VASVSLWVASEVHCICSILINLKRVVRSYLELHWKALRFLLFSSFSRVAFLALCLLCFGSATGRPVDYVRQNSATEALVPATTKLLF